MFPASKLLLLAGLAVPFTLAGLSGCGGETRRAETETTLPAPAQPQVTAPRQPSQGANLPVATVTDPRRRAYIARTDPICRRFDSERETERRRVGEAADVRGAARAYEEGTVVGEAELKRIEAVPPPPGDAALLRANVFDPVRRQLALRHQIRSALAAVNLPRLRVLRAQLDDISRALSAFARGYGWRSCGEG